MLNPTKIKWMWVQNDIALTKLTNMHATIQAKDEPPFLTYRPQPSYTLLHAHTRTSTLRIGKKPLVLSWFSFSTCLHTRSYTQVALACMRMAFACLRVAVLMIPCRFHRFLHFPRELMCFVTDCIMFCTFHAKLFGTTTNDIVFYHYIAK
jgi:hypothetical protein